MIASPGHDKKDVRFAADEIRNPENWLVTNACGTPMPVRLDPGKKTVAAAQLWLDGHGDSRHHSGYQSEPVDPDIIDLLMVPARDQPG